MISLYYRINNVVVRFCLLVVAVLSVISGYYWWCALFTVLWVVNTVYEYYPAFMRDKKG